LILEMLEGRCVPSVYTVLDLGTLGGDSSEPWGVNSSGQVCGIAQTADFPHYYHAFRYSDGGMTDLDTLGSSYSAAWAINDAGQVVGDVAVSGANRHAFLYSDNGPMVDLGTLGGDTSSAFGINNQGQVVGQAAVTGTYLTHAFLYNGNGPMMDLGTLGGDRSTAWAINDTGWVVGDSEAPGGLHAFLWEGDGPLIDLGTLGGLVSVAHAINNQGEIAGDSDTGGLGGRINHHAFLWEDGQFTDLGTLGGMTSYAYGLNNLGQVVGTADTEPGGFNPHAFLFQDGALTDLNDLLLPGDRTWTVYEGRGINDASEIVAYAVSSRGERHAVLLEPMDGQAPSVGASFTANLVPPVTIPLAAQAPIERIVESVQLGRLGEDVRRQTDAFGAAGDADVPGATLRHDALEVSLDRLEAHQACIKDVGAGIGQPQLLRVALHALAHPARQLVDAPVDALGSDGLEELQGGS
jgi:probable HAF family extracellular repeat protein